MAKATAAKGKGSASRRLEKRTAKFNPKSGGAKANVLREPGEEPAARKRVREAEEPAPAKRAYKQGPFARPEPAPRAAPEEPQAALSKKELKKEVEARKSATKPNFALIQARKPSRRRRAALTRTRCRSRARRS